MAQLSDFLRDEPSFSGHLHSEQPDRPQMTASQLKAFFDYVAVFGVAIGQVNGVINYLMSPDFSANELQIINPDSGALQSLQDGIDWLKAQDDEIRQDVQNLISNLNLDFVTDITFSSNPNAVQYSIKWLNPVTNEPKGLGSGLPISSTLQSGILTAAKFQEFQNKLDKSTVNGDILFNPDKVFTVSGDNLRYNFRYKNPVIDSGFNNFWENIPKANAFEPGILTAAKFNEIHTHQNKAVLDKFGESGGQPTYNGNPIGGGGGTSNFDDLSNRPKYNGVPMTGETNVISGGGGGDVYLSGNNTFTGDNSFSKKVKMNDSLEVPAAFVSNFINVNNAINFDAAGKNKIERNNSTNKWTAQIDNISANDGVYDNNQRVYSPVNPPPGGGSGKCLRTATIIVGNENEGDIAENCDILYNGTTITLKEIFDFVPNGFTGDIIFRRGTYNLTQTGDNQTKIIKGRIYGEDCVFQMSNNCNLLFSNSSEKVFIEGIKFQSNNVPIVKSSNSNLHFFNCNFSSVKIEQVLGVVGGNLTIDNCKLTILPDVRYINRFIMLNSHIVLHFSMAQYPAVTTGAGMDILRTTIDGCKFYITGNQSSTSYDVLFYGKNGIDISNCEFITTGNVNYRGYTLTNLNVTNCYIDGGSQWGANNVFNAFLFSTVAGTPNNLIVKILRCKHNISITIETANGNIGTYYGAGTKIREYAVIDCDFNFTFNVTNMNNGIPFVWFWNYDIARFEDNRVIINAPGIRNSDIPTRQWTVMGMQEHGQLRRNSIIPGVIDPSWNNCISAFGGYRKYIESNWVVYKDANSHIYLVEGASSARMIHRNICNRRYLSGTTDTNFPDSGSTVSGVFGFNTGNTF
ncbi:MAG: hypothetical protein FWE47_00090 [Oscillospiraceae bacterium]|nr:hypothetical protein [Oscillospiraceae bacterium]